MRLRFLRQSGPVRLDLLLSLSLRLIHLLLGGVVEAADRHVHVSKLPHRKVRPIPGVARIDHTLRDDDVGAFGSPLRSEVRQELALLHVLQGRDELHPGQNRIHLLLEDRCPHAGFSQDLLRRRLRHPRRVVENDLCIVVHLPRFLLQQDIHHLPLLVQHHRFQVAFGVRLDRKTPLLLCRHPVPLRVDVPYARRLEDVVGELLHRLARERLPSQDLGEDLLLHVQRGDHLAVCRRLHHRIIERRARFEGPVALLHRLFDHLRDQIRA